MARRREPSSMEQVAVVDMDEANTELEFREPTPDERVLLQFAAEALDDETYAEQVRDALVRFNCGCGCPTFQIRVTTDAAVTSEKYAPVDVGVAKYDGESAPAWVIAFIKDGQIDEVEVAGMADIVSRGAKLLDLTDPDGKCLYSSEGTA